MKNKETNVTVTENKTSRLDSATATYKRMGTKQRKIVNGIFTFVFVLIFFGVNVLGVFLVNRFPSLQVDLTQIRAYSLQKTTKEQLSSLDEEIKIRVLMTQEQLDALADDNNSTAYPHQVNVLLKEMGGFDKVEVEYLDLTAITTNQLSKSYPDVDWTSNDNFLIVENADGSKYELVSKSDVFSYDATYASYYQMRVIDKQYVEQAVLTAIQQITADKLVKVAVSIGNGEVTNSSSSEYSYYSYLPALLKSNAFEYEEIDLSTQAPADDVDVILMIAPRRDLTDEAAERLATWLDNDGAYGKSLIYSPFMEDSDTPNIDLFLEQWGLKVGNGYINETDLTKLVNTMCPKVDYADPVYTEGLKDTTNAVVAPYCKPVEIVNAEMASPLLTTSTDANVVYAPENDDEDVTYSKSTGEALNAAAIGTKTNEETEATSNVVVWGSYLGLDYAAVYNYGNIPYFINLLDIFTENQLDGIVLPGVTLESSTITVTAAQKITVFVFFVVLIPLAIFVIGLVVWVKRRNR